MNKDARISLHEMTQYRERLMSQKKFLTDILSKIEKQMLALQVCKNLNIKLYTLSSLILIYEKYLNRLNDYT